MWPSDSIASIWRYRYQKLYLLVCVVMVGVEVVVVKWLKSIDRVSYLQRVSYVWRLPPRILAIMHEHETSTSNQKIWTKKYCGVDGKKEKYASKIFRKNMDVCSIGVEFHLSRIYALSTTFSKTPSLLTY